MLPAIESESQLDELLSTPTPAVLDALRRVPGDVLVMGAGGKIGLSLVQMLSRASAELQQDRRIVAASRFSRPEILRQFEELNVETKVGNLLDESFLSNLPILPNLIFMTGTKFGTGSAAAQTWGMNVVLPTLVCRRFPASRILAYSTGNVYPLVAVKSGGSCETDCVEPIGEYGMSALGRERVFEYYSLHHRQPVVIVRLNYAVELRYGILVDLAQLIVSQQPIDLTMGHANVIWQGDANSHTLCALADADCPAVPINVAGPEIFNVRNVCEALGERLGVTPRFQNRPAPDALLNNASQTHRRYGPPRIDLAQLIEWTADWIKNRRPTWNKPTHFQTRNGRF